MTLEEVLNPPINEKLSHLTKDEINELIEFYYLGENIDNLIKTYKINTDKHNLSYLFPPQVLEGFKCKYCSFPMWKNRSSRSTNKDNIAYCPNCKHKDTSDCLCENCQKLQQELLQKQNETKEANLRKTINIDFYNPLDYYEISDEYKIYLGALIRAGLSENLEYIIPLDSFSEKFTPSSEFDEEVVKKLRCSNVIKIHPYSNPNCFTNVTEEGNFRFYLKKVYWHINLYYTDSTEQFFSKLINYEEPIEDKDLLLQLWRKISLLECLEYLDYQLELVGLSYDTGDKTKMVFEELLNNFSAGQIYGIIWSSVTHAVRFHREKHPPAQNAAKAVITNCQRYGEKALIEKWNVKTFSRIKELPQSSFSKYLFNRVLKIGDNGFNMKPDISNVIIDYQADGT
jgi:hypothetical protein